MIAGILIGIIICVAAVRCMFSMLGDSMPNLIGTIVVAVILISLLVWVGC